MEHRIKDDDLPKFPANYIILKRCHLCEEEPEAWPMEFPSEKAANAYLEALVEMHKEHEQSHEVIDGVHHIVDDDGEKHEIVFAIMQITKTAKILWQSGDDIAQKQINQEFDDIIKNLDIE